jgi:hypothetical protein
MDIVGEIDREPKSTLRRRRAGKIDFLLDDKEEMTYGRRIGEFFKLKNHITFVALFSYMNFQ